MRNMVRVKNDCPKPWPSPRLYVGHTPEPPRHQRPGRRAGSNLEPGDLPQFKCNGREPLSELTAPSATRLPASKPNREVHRGTSNEQNFRNSRPSHSPAPVRLSPTTAGRNDTTEFHAGISVGIGHRSWLRPSTFVVAVGLIAAFMPTVSSYRVVRCRHRCRNRAAALPP